jgi:peptidyl-dipeptidase A
MPPMKFLARVALPALAIALATSIATPAFAQDAAPAADPSRTPVVQASGFPMTAQGAGAWLAAVEKDLFAFSHDYGRVQWVNATYLTEDTDALAATYGTIATEKSVRYALDAAKFATVAGLDPVVARKLTILRTGIVLPAPTTPGAAAELATISTDLQSQYGKGRGMLKGQPINGSDIEAEMGNLTHTPAEFAEMWASWHDTVGAPMKDDYARMVAIANEGAKELGFADAGAMWRSNYDMDPDAFAAETEKLWQEVKPLYLALHTYVRSKLNAKYGDAVQPASGAIRADLLGNMWAQQWGNIYPLVAPAGAGDIGYDLTQLIEAKGLSEIEMVRTGEGFFSSLGMAPLPETFWTRSQFVKPADREVICHASAWDLDNIDDLRIKMCIKKNADDFVTIHHELGHNYYQRAYNKQDYLHLNGANDGFHEAIGDMVALSITPEYLVQIDMLDRARVPGADKDIGLLLAQALDKVAFLPFGLLVDKWRWGVFDGSITPATYNQAWVDLKREYQGVTPPVERPADAFDPGAKFHIPGNTPYMRYFLAHILQFQFYKAACDQAGWTGPLHRCSFFGDKEVGAKLNAMLEMGASKPWPDALEAFTGTREMSGTAIVEYFKPLLDWLNQQNAGKTEGW